MDEEIFLPEDYGHEDCFVCEEARRRQTMEFSTKPDLTLYIGKYVQTIIRDDENPEPWKWGIRFDNGVEIRNKDRREVFVPQDIVGKQLKTITFSEGDTTLVFTGGLKWSLNPTQYAIHDPAHGGEVYPQWPEELEEAGIPSHPDEDVSSAPDDPEGWSKHRTNIQMEHDRRITRQANDWLQEEAQDD